VTASAFIASEDAREIRCPRCGYDQRGALSTWTQSCPVEGVCTECGLTFIWCEVLRPEKFEPRWCIEFEPRKRRLLWAALRTCVRSFWPWGFWSRLKMSDAIHWRRLALYALLVLLPLLMLYVWGQGANALITRTAIQRELATRAQFRGMQINQLTAQVQATTNALRGDPMLDQPVQAQINFLNGRITRLQTMGTSVEYIDASWVATTWEAIAFPTRQYSAASIVSPVPGVAPQPYVPPIMLLGPLAQWISPNFFGWNRPDETLVLLAGWLAWGVGMTLLLPLSFVLMPLSLRKAKVRWSHLVRVAVYSLFIPVPVLIAAALGFVLAVVVLDQPEWIERMAGIARYLPWLAVALWWHAATSRYLKIPHAWLTIGMLTLMCLLILLGLTAAVSLRLAWAMLDFFGPLVP
jgi:hypothetical protein